MTIEENVRLSPLTTFRVGGPARFFVHAKSLHELKEGLSYAKLHKLETTVIGGGSNIVVSDEGIRGLVIKNGLLGIEFLQKGKSQILIASAGEVWDDIVALAVSRNLYGIENLSGIPGNVGAAPVQNIGAYGTEIKDSLLWVEAIHKSTGKLKKFMNRECKFRYRDSFFKQKSGKNYVITRVALRLNENGKPNLNYKDVKNFFADRKTTPTLAEVRSTVLQIRSKKFPDLTKFGSAGSFFKNPVVTLAKARALLKRYPDIPAHKDSSGKMKLSLAYMIDKICHLKGLSVGGAQVSEHQALALLNNGGATAQDIKTLSEKVMQAVEKETGIIIEPEVQFIP